MNSFNCTKSTKLRPARASTRSVQGFPKTEFSNRGSDKTGPISLGLCGLLSCVMGDNELWTSKFLADDVTITGRPCRRPIFFSISPFELILITICFTLPTKFPLAHLRTSDLGKQSTPRCKHTTNNALTVSDDCHCVYLCHSQVSVSVIA